MKRVFALLVILVFIAGLVACASEPEDRGIHGAIHRVEYGGNVAYLFGTLHGGHDHWFPLDDVVEDALRRSDLVAIEVDMDELEEGMDTTVMFLPDGYTWVDILPADVYYHLVEMIEKWEFSYANLNNMNPSVLVFLLEFEMAVSLSELGVDIEDSVDAYIEAVARELGLPVIGLESIEQQMDILFNPPFEVMLAQIINFLPPEELMELITYGEAASLDQLAYYYENNDLDALIREFSLEIDAGTECPYAIYMRDIIMNWRSTYYANEIARLLRETQEPTTFFVAVGLSHIIRSEAGEEFTDIVEQLRLQGFTVVPIWR